MPDIIPGQQIIDPNLQGIYGIQDALQLSGLAVGEAVVGQPVQVIFTATNVGSGTFAGLEGGSVENACDTITGLITTAGGIVVAKLSSQQICVGPFGSAIPLFQYRAVSLQSVGVLPAQYAGTDLSGAPINAYVGSHTQFDAYQVGDQFAPDLSTMLQASITVTGQAPPFPGSGGGTPPASGGGETPPSSGGGSGGGSTGGGGGTNPPTVGSNPPATSPGLSTTEKAVLVGAGLLVVVGGAWVLSNRGG